jgi:cytochrome c553
MNKSIILLAAFLASVIGVTGLRATIDSPEQDEAMEVYKYFKFKSPEEHSLIRFDGQTVYHQVCASCHLKKGWGTPDGSFPQLSGQPASVLIKQLADIRAKNRDNPTMYPFTLPETIKKRVPEVGGGAYALAAVAYYIETLSMNPAPGLGPGKDLKYGAQVYKKNCARCHGANGEGNAEQHYPLIQGQHYAYLLRQFIWIMKGKRRNANPDMVKQIKNFSKRDIIAVLDYVSRLKPTPKKARLSN